MFTLYCDDSGTHPESDIAVAACYISTVDQWAELGRNWDEINAREQFGVFHMADFVAKKEQFAAPEWSDQPKRDRTIQSLINVIKTRTRIGFSAVVIKSAYDEVVVGSKLREKFGDNHYAFVVRLCTALVDRWRQKYRYDAPIEYVFDRLSKGRGDINSIFEKLLLGGEDATRRYGVYRDCWSFQDKAQVIQLQAADIWAWENYRYMRDCVLPTAIDGKKRQPRQSYLALRDSPAQMRYHVKDSLEELAKKADEMLGA